MALLVNPANRWGACLAELPTSSKLILFGGKTTGFSYHGILNDSFSWNGTVWANVSTGISGNTLTGPSPRYDACAAYDGTNITMVGGRDLGGNSLSETWSYATAGGWFQQTVAEKETALGGAPSYGIYSNPTLLSGASFAYQSGVSGGECVLFGGEASYQRHYCPDSWVWVKGNPGTWTLLSPAVFPSGRKYAAFASNATTAILYGGKNLDGASSQTFSWNGTVFSQITGLNIGTTSPPALYGASMAYEAATSKFVLHGGIGNDGNYSGQTWTYSTGSSTWSLVSGVSPPPRAFSSMAYLTANTTVLLFGGLGYDRGFGDTWSYTNGVWTQLG